MGLGSTAKKLQKLGDVAEELFKRVNAMRDEIDDLQATVDHAESDAAAVRRELAEQRVVLEALAEREGIDTDELVAAADIPDPAGERDDETD